MRAYYGSRISENMTVTPEGFLICLGVPIARTGTQEYLPGEIGLEGSGLVPVVRLPEEVFSTAALASFEGKPVTLDHPATAVEPNNASAYIKGHAQNIRQGVGEESDLILADLFITDQELIRMIREENMREVSCGYECNYDSGPDGTIYQRSIRGNHIAVVTSGRAGGRVAIKDTAPQNKKDGKEGRSNPMNKKTNNTLFGRMFARWVKDAEPEEIADALDELVEQAKGGDETPPAPAPAPVPADQEPVEQQQTDSPEVLAQLAQAVQALTAKFDALIAAKGVDEDPLQKLEDELTAQAPAQDSEESTTIEVDEDPEVKDEEPALSSGEEGPISSPAARPENPIPGADSAAMLAAIKAIKPIIAKLPQNERREASDAAVRNIRAAMGKPAKAKANGYSAINQVRRAADNKTADEAKIGRDIMAKHNPHYKAKGGNQ